MFLFLLSANTEGLKKEWSIHSGDDSVKIQIKRVLVGYLPNNSKSPAVGMGAWSPGCWGKVEIVFSSCPASDGIWSMKDKWKVSQFVIICHNRLIIRV